MLNLKLTTIMELYELKDSREFKAAKQLEEALNDYGFDYKKFTEAIPHMHPTLQQNLYRLIRECILFMADKNNRYIDLRNRASLEGAQAVAEIMRQQSIPFV